MGHANGWRLSDCRTVTSHHPAPVELCQLPPAHTLNTLCERELGLGSGWGARARATRGRRTTVVIAVAFDASTMAWQPWLSQLSHAVVVVVSHVEPANHTHSHSAARQDWVQGCGQSPGPLESNSAQRRTRGVAVGSRSSSKMVIFMSPEMCCLIKSLHDTAELPDPLGSTRLAESFTDTRLISQLPTNGEL